MDTEAAAKVLAEIAHLLETGHEEQLAYRVQDSLSGSDQAIEEFLRSNELWGGAGSIADEAFSGGRSAQRKELEALLIRLGTIQLDYGVANIRTKVWVQAFEKWQRLGI